MVFDAPKLKMSFEKRLKKLETVLSACDPNVVVLHAH